MFMLRGRCYELNRAFTKKKRYVQNVTLLGDKDLTEEIQLKYGHRVG